MLVITSRAGAVAKYCDEYVCLCVCLSVCLSARISPDSGTVLPIFTEIFVHDTYVRGAVLLRHVYYRPHRLSQGRGFVAH